MFEPKIYGLNSQVYGITIFYCKSIYENKNTPEEFDENDYPCLNCSKINCCMLWDEEFSKFYKKHKYCNGRDAGEHSCINLLARPYVFLMKKAEEKLNMVNFPIPGYNFMDIQKYTRKLMYLCCDHHPIAVKKLILEI